MAWYTKYVGIPFVEKGRDENGCDCWGLVRLIYKNELGIDLPDYLDCYETTNDREKLSSVIKEQTEKNWVSDQEHKEFDVIILMMRGVPMHVGVVTKKNHMIHCARGIGTVFENFKTARWKHKVMGFERLEKN